MPLWICLNYGSGYLLISTDIFINLQISKGSAMFYLCLTSHILINRSLYVILKTTIDISSLLWGIPAWTGKNQSSCPWDFHRKEYWRGCRTLPLGDLPDLWMELRCPHCWWILPIEPPGKEGTNAAPVMSLLFVTPEHTAHGTAATTWAHVI